VDAPEAVAPPSPSGVGQLGTAWAAATGCATAFAEGDWVARWVTNDPKAIPPPKRAACTQRRREGTGKDRQRNMGMKIERVQATTSRRIRRISHVKKPQKRAGVDVYLEGVNPISRNRCARYSPAEMGGSWGCSPSATHWGNAAKLIEGRGWQKNGMLNRGVAHISRGGFTTRCVVDFRWWFVSR